MSFTQHIFLNLIFLVLHNILSLIFFIFLVNIFAFAFLRNMFFEILHFVILLNVFLILSFYATYFLSYRSPKSKTSCIFMVSGLPMWSWKCTFLDIARSIFIFMLWDQSGAEKPWTIDQKHGAWKMMKFPMGNHDFVLRTRKPTTPSEEF